MEQIDSVTPAAMLRLKNNNTQSAADAPHSLCPKQLTQPTDKLRDSPELIDKLYHDKDKHSAELKFNVVVKGFYIRNVTKGI